MVRACTTIGSLKALVLNRILAGADLGLKDLIFCIAAKFDVTEELLDEQIKDVLQSDALGDGRKLEPKQTSEILAKLPLVAVAQRAKGRSLRSGWKHAQQSAAARERASERSQKSLELTAGHGVRVANLAELDALLHEEGNDENTKPFLLDMTQRTIDAHGVHLLNRRRRVVQLAAAAPLEAARKLLHVLEDPRAFHSNKAISKKILLFVGKVTFGNGKRI